MKSLAVFIVGGLLFGATALGIGYTVDGTDSLRQGGTAFGLTFVPAAVTLAWVVYSYRADPHMMLLASLGGSGLRMAVSLGGGYYLTQALPQQFDGAFWCWLVLFYLVLLTFEITLLVRQANKVSVAPKV